VIRDVMTPRFQAGDYDRGISDGVGSSDCSPSLAS